MTIRSLQIIGGRRRCGHREPPILQPFTIYPNDWRKSEPAYMLCLAVNGTLPLTFRWNKNRCCLPENGKITNGDYYSLLVILPNNKNSEGNYTCTVENAEGSDSYTELLTARKEPPKIQPFSFNRRNREEEIAYTMCMVEVATSPVTFEWYKDGCNVLAHNDPTINITSTDNYSLLVILHANEHNVGKYTCTAKNADGSDSYTALLDSGENADKGPPPIIRPFSFAPSNWIETQSAFAMCLVDDANFPVKFQWFKDGWGVHNGPQLKITNSNTFSLLVMLRADKSSEGNYTCVAKSSDGSIGYKAPLVAKKGPAPKIRPFSFFPRKWSNAQSAYAKCLVKNAILPVKFQWYKDGWTVHGEPTIKITDTDYFSTIVILRSDTENSEGNYTCVAKNADGIDSFTARLVVDKGLRPKIQPFSFRTSNSKKDQTVFTTCVVENATLPLKFEWYKNGCSVRNEPTIRIIDGDSFSILVILRHNENSEGSYTCSAKNADGSDSYSASLVADTRGVSHVSETGPPKIRPFAFYPSNWRRNQRAFAACSVESATLPIKFHWYKDDSNIPVHNDATTTIIDGDKMSLLVILRGNENSEGSYTCHASNADGSHSYTEFLVYEKVHPKIRPFYFAPLNWIKARSASTMCMVDDATFPVNFQWLKDGKSVHNEPTIKITDTDNFSLLIVLRADKTSEGNYTCIAENSGGLDRHSALLVADKAPPRIRPFKFHPSKWTKAQGAYTKCVVSNGSLPLKFEWSKNGRLLRNESTISIIDGDNFSILVVLRGSENSEGNYTCTAKNADGSDSHTAILVDYKETEIRRFSFYPRNWTNGQSAYAMCFVENAELPLTFKWLKDEVSVRKQLAVTITSMDNFSILVILPGNNNSEGKYRCTAMNGFDLYSSTTHLVAVKGAPKIRPFSFHYDYRGEDPIAFTLCLAENARSPFTIRWDKDGSPVRNGSAIKITNVDNYSVLVYLGPNKDSEGNYTCTVENAEGSGSHTAPLVVPKREPPTWVPDRPSVTEEPVVTVTEGPVVTVTDGPVVTVTDGPVVTVTDGPVVTVTDGPVVTVTDGPVVTVTDGPVDRKPEGPVNPELRLIMKVSVGANVPLSCESKGMPVPHITWYAKIDYPFYHQLPIGKHENMEIRRFVKENTIGVDLFITSIRPYQFGEYKCEIHNGVPPDLRKVITIKPIEESDIEDVVVNHRWCGTRLSDHTRWCGTRLPGHKKDAGPEEEQLDWPWMAAIFQDITRTPVRKSARDGGGTLITKRHVLTNTLAFRTRENKTAKQYSVALGANFVNDTFYDGILYNVDKYIIHNNFDPEWRVNDIALLFLAETVEFTLNLLPICLPDSNFITSIGTEALTLGWDDKADDNEIRNDLQERHVTVSSHEICKKTLFTELVSRYIQHEGENYDEKITCTTSQKDGPPERFVGGPLMLQIGNRWTEIGILSLVSPRSCPKPDNPALFTEVSYYRTWIDKLISSNKP